MAGLVLVLNAGSSSLKFRAYAAGTGLGLVLRGQLEGLYTTPRFSAFDAAGAPIGTQSWPAGGDFGHAGAIAFLGDFLRRHGEGQTLVAVGHRVVHGAMAYAEPVRVTPEVLAALEQLVPLAPLHQPHNLAAIRSVAELRPGLPQVACFDTAFHRSQPEVAQAFALPPSITDKVTVTERGGQHAVTRYAVEASAPGRQLVRLWPETGRTHQLRVHLAALGAPILGDRLYGTPESAPRLLLHARRITLPPDAPLPGRSYVAPLPPEMML